MPASGMAASDVSAATPNNAVRYELIYENPRTYLSGGFCLFLAGWTAPGVRERDSVKPPGQPILWRFRRFPEYIENFVSECYFMGLLGSVQVRRPA